MNECGTCHNENDPAARFCIGCGGALFVRCGRCSSRCAPFAKFCQTCGNPLLVGGAISVDSSSAVFLPASAVGERKLVTIVFADIVASTKLIENLDSDQAGDQLQRSVEGMRQAVRRFGGTVNKIQGDGVMALFGTPLPLEDHACRACMAALAMRDFARTSQDQNLQLRIGIHTGEVNVRAIDNDLFRQYDALGIAVHLAARIQQAAGPDNILISAATVDAARGTIEVRQRGSTVLKGFSSCIDLFDLSGVNLSPTIAARKTRPLSRFVGRRRELRALEKVLHAASAEKRVVEVIGEPGVGKSRLVSEFRARAETADSRIIEISAYSYGALTPLQVAVDLLRRMLGLSISQGGAEIDEKVHDSLDELGLAELSPLISHFLGGGNSPVTAVSSGGVHGRDQLIEAVREITRAVAANGRTVFVMEDAHWIDEASKPFVGAVARALSGTQSMLLLTRRTDSKSFLKDFVEVNELVLPLLDRGALEALVDEALFLKGSISTELKRQIAQRSSGNPFFAEELIRALDDQSAFGIELTATADAKVPLKLPNTIRGLIAFRIDKIPFPQKQVLQAASILGLGFTTEIVALVAEFSQEESQDCIDKLIENEFVCASESGSPFELEFKHPLVQEVAYASLVAEHRRPMHCRAATGLLALFSTAIEQNSALIAHHFSQAGDHVQSASYYMRAAQWMAARDSSQAIDAWHRVRKELSSAPKNQQTLYLSMVACGQAVNLAWRESASAESVEPIFNEGMKYAHEIRDVRAGALLTMAYGRVLLATGSADKYIAKVKEAQSFIETSPNSSVEALLVAVLSHAVGCSGKLVDAIQLNRRALSIETRINSADRQLLGFNPKYWLWGLLARNLALSAKIDEAQYYIDRLLDDSSETVDVLHQAIALGVQIDWAALAGDESLARRTLTRLTALLEKNRTPYLVALGDHYRAIALLTMRHTDDARAVLQRLLVFIRGSRAGLEFEPFVLVNLGESLSQISPTESFARIDEGRWLARVRSSRIGEAYALASRLRTSKLLQLQAPEEDAAELQRLIEETGADALNYQLRDLRPPHSL
jgi:adenylate cyclase